MLEFTQMPDDSSQSALPPRGQVAVASPTRLINLGACDVRGMASIMIFLLIHPGNYAASLATVSLERAAAPCFGEHIEPEEQGRQDAGQSTLRGSDCHELALWLCSPGLPTVTSRQLYSLAL